MENKVRPEHGNFVAKTQYALKKFGKKLKIFIKEKSRIHAGKVSTVHYHEAHERYWILWRDLEAALHKHAHSLEKFSFKELNQDNLETAEAIDDYFHETIQLLKNVRTQKSSETESANGNNHIDTIMNILPYYKIMARNRKRLSTSEKDLNTLWQDMNFIRIRLLNEVYKNEDDFDLALYLDFCREEAQGLKVQDDLEVKELLHAAALGLGGCPRMPFFPSSSSFEKKCLFSDSLLVVKEEQSSGQKAGKNSEQTIRTISTLLARLKRLRLKRFHDQLYRKNAYKGTLFFLLPLAIILMYGHAVILNTEEISPQGLLLKLPDLEVFIFQLPLPDLLTTLLSWLSQLIEMFGDLLFANPLLFIFFAGLIGGFFSAIMRLRDNKDQIDEWAYFKWYLFTKPFFGALGAIILFIALRANFMNIGELTNSNGVLELIKSSPLSAPGFTFGFIMGFTERLILPRLNKE